MSATQNDKVSNLIAISANEVSADDLFFLADSSARESKKLSVANLITYVNASSSIDALHAASADTASYIAGSGVNGAVTSASFATNAGSASHALTANTAVTAAFASSISAIGSVPTASYLLYSGVPNGTASFALTASLVNNALTASYIQFVPGQSNGSASYALSSSIATTASFALASGQSVTLADTASLALTASTARTASFVNPLTIYGAGAVKAWAFVTWSVANAQLPVLYESYNIANITWRGAVAIDASNYYDHYTIEFTAPLPNTDYMMMGDGIGQVAPWTTGFSSTTPINGQPFMLPKYPKYTTGCSMSFHTRGAVEHGYFFNYLGSSMTIVIIGL